MNYNIFASLRPDKRDKQGLEPIYIFIYEGHDLIKKESSGKKVSPEFWDKDAREVVKKFPNATLINPVISKKINEFKTKILKEELIKDKVNISEILQREKAKDMCFLNLQKSR